MFINSLPKEFYILYSGRILKMNNAVCIHCGASSSSIYKQFSKEIIKLSTCEKCGELVDEYVETESSILIIDMLLLKKSALRHVLFNTELQGAWKLIVLFILCDAYEKICRKYFSQSSLENGEHIIDLELNFYLMCVKSALEYSMFSALILIALYQSHKRSSKKFSSKSFFHCIILASYGKLFMLPLLIWSKSDEYSEALIVLFIFLSQIQVFRVTTDFSTIVIALVLIVISEACFIILHKIT